MDDQIKLLKQQVAAAEFLVRNLKTQLREAEERAAAGGPPESVNNESRQANENGSGTAQLGGNVNDHQPGSRSSQIDRNQVLYEVPQATIGTDEHEANEQDVNLGDDSTESLPAFNLPSLEVGLVYPSLEDIKSAVLAHAISQGWTAGVHKRDKTRIVLRCRTGSECPFHIRAEQYPYGAKICAYKPDHNCSFQSDQGHISRSHVSSLRFLKEQLPSFMNVDESTTAKQISDAIFQRFGTRVSAKQCRHLKVGPKRKRTPTVATCGRCGAVGHNRKTCVRNGGPVVTPPPPDLGVVHAT